MILGRKLPRKHNALTVLTLYDLKLYLDVKDQRACARRCRERFCVARGEFNITELSFPSSNFLKIFLFSRNVLISPKKIPKQTSGIFLLFQFQGVIISLSYCKVGAPFQFPQPFRMELLLCVLSFFQRKEAARNTAGKESADPFDSVRTLIIPRFYRGSDQ